MNAMATNWRNNFRIPCVLYWLDNNNQKYFSLLRFSAWSISVEFLSSLYHFYHDRLNRPLKSKETGEERNYVSFEGRPEHGNDFLTSVHMQLNSGRMRNPLGANHGRRGIPDRAVWVRAPTGVIVCVVGHFTFTLPLSTRVKKCIIWVNTYGYTADQEYVKANTIFFYMPFCRACQESLVHCCRNTTF